MPASTLKHNCFVSLPSRLGLRFAPHGAVVPNIGVEEGAAVLLDHVQPLSRFDQSLTFSFADPLRLASDTYLETILRQYVAVKQQVLEQWQRDTRLVFLGGDHSIGFVGLATALEVFGPENVGTIMFDSHADLHLPSTSPSGNFHGMWLRALTDTFETFESGDFGQKLPPTQLQFVGNLLVEEEEVRYITEHAIPVHSSQTLTPQTATELLTWSKQFEHLHISFDVDIFKQKLVSATGTPNPKGMEVHEVFPLLEALRQHPSFSLDIVEVNPQKKGAAKTIAIAEEVLDTLLFVPRDEDSYVQQSPTVISK